MILYRAPIWANYITVASHKALRRIQRRMATRIIRAYRTVSHDAVTIAGMIPFSIQAKIEADIFEQVRAIKANGETITKADKMRRNALQPARKAIEELENDGTARPAIRAIASHWEQWAAHGTGKLTYRTTQVITGHGCFGEYLRIGADTTAAC